MAEQGLYKYYSDLPGWAKGVVVVGSLGIVAIIVMQVYSRVKKEAGMRQALQTIKETDKELQDNIKAGVKPTITKSQADGWSGQIQKAFDGCDPLDTAVGTVTNIFLQLKNDSDFLLLVKSYGVRSYDQCGWGAGDFQGDLYQAIQDELSINERNLLNYTLAKQKITYKV